MRGLIVLAPSGKSAVYSLQMKKMGGKPIFFWLRGVLLLSALLVAMQPYLAAFPKWSLREWQLVPRRLLLY